MIHPTTNYKREIKALVGDPDVFPVTLPGAWGTEAVDFTSDLAALLFRDLQLGMTDTTLQDDRAYAVSSVLGHSLVTDVVSTEATSLITNSQIQMIDTSMDTVVIVTTKGNTLTII